MVQNYVYDLLPTALRLWSPPHVLFVAGKTSTYS